MPPEKIIASHLTNGKVDRTLPLCPYPQVQVYNGSGDANMAENYHCVDHRLPLGDRGSHAAEESLGFNGSREEKAGAAIDEMTSLFGPGANFQGHVQTLSVARIHNIARMCENLRLA